MSKDFDIEKGIFGKKMVVKGKWKDKNKIVLIEQNVKELELNSGKGWKDRRVDFLKNLDFLQSLTIRGIGEPIEDISGIHYLNQLKYLDVETYCKTKIDFFCFPKLEECVFEWRPKSESLFGCTKLKKLWINSYKKRDTEDFKALKNLQHLGFGNGPVASLAGLSGLSKLRYLEIFGLRKLQSLEGIEKLKDLEQLEVYNCKYFKSIEPIGSLKKLKRLLLVNCGDIHSLKPLQNNKNLEEFLMYESTNILDGDITPLLKLKKLKKAFSGPNRKHYSHKIDFDEDQYVVEENQ